MLHSELQNCFTPLPVSELFALSGFCLHHWRAISVRSHHGCVR